MGPDDYREFGIKCGIPIKTTSFSNDDGTFNFCNFTYMDNFNDFYHDAQECIRKTLDNKDELEAKSERDDLIHYSVIPWISFNSISNARRFDKKDSIPNNRVKRFIVVQIIVFLFLF